MKEPYFPNKPEPLVVLTDGVTQKVFLMIDADGKFHSVDWERLRQCAREARAGMPVLPATAIGASIWFARNSGIEP